MENKTDRLYDEIQMMESYEHALTMAFRSTGYEKLNEKVVQRAIVYQLKGMKVEHEVESRLNNKSTRRVDIAGKDWLCEVKLGDDNIPAGIGQILHYSQMSGKNCLVLAVHDDRARIDFDLVSTADEHGIVLCRAWMAAACIAEQLELQDPTD
jgi:hypothetical protein